METECLDLNFSQSDSCPPLEQVKRKVEHTIAFKCFVPHSGGLLVLTGANAALEGTPGERSKRFEIKSHAC